MSNRSFFHEVGHGSLAQRGIGICLAVHILLSAYVLTRVEIGNECWWCYHHL